MLLASPIKIHSAEFDSPYTPEHAGALFITDMAVKDMGAPCSNGMLWFITSLYFYDWFNVGGLHHRGRSNPLLLTPFQSLICFLLLPLNDHWPEVFAHYLVAA
jgi:hypothetical protein